MLTENDFLVSCDTFDMVSSSDVCDVAEVISSEIIASEAFQSNISETISLPVVKAIYEELSVSSDVSLPNITTVILMINKEICEQIPHIVGHVFEQITAD